MDTPHPNGYDRILMKLEVVRGETLGKLNILFRQKVQLKEQYDENEVLIHFERGKMQAFEDYQKIIQEIQKADKIEAIRATRIKPPEPVSEVIK